MKLAKTLGAGAAFVIGAGVLISYFPGNTNDAYIFYGGLLAWHIGVHMLEDLYMKKKGGCNC